MSDLKLKVDDRLMEYLKLAAEATGLAVEEVAVKALEVGIKHYSEGRRAIADHIRSRQTKPVEDDSTDIIRRLRNAS